jgi:hypothetical protein
VEGLELESRALLSSMSFQTFLPATSAHNVLLHAELHRLQVLEAALHHGPGRTHEVVVAHKIEMAGGGGGGGGGDVWTVTKSTDSAQGTSGQLRWAVTQANAYGGTIVFASNVTQVNLTYGPLLAAGDFTVTTRPNTVTVSSGQTIWDIENGANVTINGLTMNETGNWFGALVGNSSGTATATLTETQTLTEGEWTPGSSSNQSIGVYVGNGGVFNPVSGNGFGNLNTAVSTTGTGVVDNVVSGFPPLNFVVYCGTGLVLNGANSTVYNFSTLYCSIGVISENGPNTLDNLFLEDSTGMALIAYIGPGQTFNLINT